MESATSSCRQCGHNLRGRVDKKFCNDHCRNAFHFDLNRGRDAIVRQVHTVLLRNRRILRKLFGRRCKVTRDELLLEGFHFAYHTHQLQKRPGVVEYFCYEFGWRELRQNQVLLIVSGAN
jgi:hypothetical protein